MPVTPGLKTTERPFASKRLRRTFFTSSSDEVRVMVRERSQGMSETPCAIADCMKTNKANIGSDIRHSVGNIFAKTLAVTALISPHRMKGVIDRSDPSPNQSSSKQ